MKPFMRKRTIAGTRSPLPKVVAWGLGLISCALLVSCNGQKRVSEETHNGSNMAYRLTLLLEDDYSGTETEQTLIIRNEKELREFFVNVNKTRKPGIPVPEVDFSKKTVLIYCAGEKESRTLPELFVKDVTKEDIVIAPVFGKEPIKPTSRATVSPFRMYTISTTGKKIIFQNNR